MSSVNLDELDIIREDLTQDRALPIYDVGDDAQAIFVWINNQHSQQLHLDECCRAIIPLFPELDELKALGELYHLDNCNEFIIVIRDNLKGILGIVKDKSKEI